MYEDLVKRLRERAIWINFPRHGEEHPNDDAKLMMDAANAIEELSREIDIDNAAMTAMDAAMPRWIPVDERLPEQGERVIVTNGGGFVCESFLAKNGKWQRGGVDMFFMTPTYWMPLQEPPKEET